MSNGLDSRGRRAASGLRSTVEKAELSSTPPGKTDTGPDRRIRGLRPATVLAMLVLGSAVGVAMVVGPLSAPEPTVPPSTTTSVPATTTSTGTVPTTVAPVVSPPVSTAPEDVEPPMLEITTPADGAIFTEKTVTFRGRTEPGARVFAGRWEAEVDADGSWRIVLVLAEGANRARFTASDAAGNETQASITVHYAVTTTTTKPDKPKPDLAPFTAHATFGSCDETPPFDVYYGTGEPGSKVNVESAHGSGSVIVGDNGKWQVTVFFPTAPPGEVFGVKVYDDHGRKKTFDFVYEP
jgi:large repetitive protein